MAGELGLTLISGLFSLGLTLMVNEERLKREQRENDTQPCRWCIPCSRNIRKSAQNFPHIEGQTSHWDRQYGFIFVPLSAGLDGVKDTLADKVGKFTG